MILVGVSLLWLHTLSITLPLLFSCWSGVLKLTIAAVKEFGDDGSAAGGPRTGAIDLNEGGGHHVVVLQFPKYVCTGFDIVMWHVEHMSCGVGTTHQMSCTDGEIYLSVMRYVALLGGRGAALASEPLNVK